ncbi:sugar O-acetyltransferase [Romboutsia weinsteinii]|uniref:Acetyltransferase n=1 Tax=Romboutsia weinsteinii TaxID=2020949 RepID=A0A371IYB1_9FIRM|nr:sugar O-acetyltransferase [Romboutsia weinsteinii]RDY25472.1 sugar O-acetyltransferase [Romboutsia weinsteinii]
MDIKTRMKTSKLYYCNDEELMKEQAECLEILYDFNQTRPSEQEKRNEILKKLFADIGDNCYIEPPLRANWGKNVHIGNDFYANFNLTLVDDTDVYIGNNVLIGPNVVIDTGTHPIRPDIRAKQAQYNVAVTIEDNVWIGAGAIILPGVCIGKNTVIGAGSIVTRDIPANVVAIGSPCRVLREINENDMKYYYKNMEIDID